jgi:hypothetical protein
VAAVSFFVVRHAVVGLLVAPSYLAALVASRFSPELKALAQQADLASDL